MNYSKLKEKIFDVVYNNPLHMTAEQVLSKVNTADTNVSQATVYRNLSKLVEEGRLRKLTIAGEPDRFDGNIAIHGHFYCNNCKKVYDLDIDNDIVKQIQQGTNHKIMDSDLIFYGICKDCIGGKND